MVQATLSKSRFKLALECPTKVHYSLRRSEGYVDRRQDDEFMEALAKGGHQVGALAKLMFRARDPEAVEITAEDQDEQVRQTAELLTRERVTIFEGTVRHENLLVRVDVLVKRGNLVELVEVKAKSWDPAEDALTGRTPKSNPITPDWEPYVYDVAFQQYVVSKAHPGLEVHPYLMLVDKSRRNSVAGLGAMFPVLGEGRNTRVEPVEHLDLAALTEPLLVQVDAAVAVELAQTIVRDRPGRPALVFEPLIRQVAGAIARGERIPPQPSRMCKHCEFYVEPAERSESRRSGWAECMESYFRRPVDRPRGESIFGLYHNANLEGHLAARRLWLAECSEADLEARPKPDEISRTERQALQWREIVEGDREPFVETGPLREALLGLRFPLHFIDFETAAPALPFHVGQWPYQPILFQFSHHVVERDGTVRHAHECLIVDGGRSPSIEVLRQLQAAIGEDAGSVLHWYPHERTILRSVKREIAEAMPADAETLMAFLDGLGVEKDAEGRLFDLGRLVERQVFLPGTGGSSSMKRFLPAVLRHSQAVRRRYSQPVYGTAAMPSLNFQSQAWVVEHEGRTLDPYQLLEPVFEDREVNGALEWLEENEGEAVANGAAAMIAYATLQSPQTTAAQRAALERQLKRYCELDTLAMVMVYEALREWAALVD
jgi:hypothetical protein